MNAHNLPSMPIRLTDRQEQFCQYILGGKAYSEAYRLAYGAGQRASESNGSRMMRNDRVTARIAQLRADADAAGRVSLPFLTGLLRRAYDVGERTNQSSAMAQAAMGMAKLHGFLIDKTQSELIIRRPSMEPSSPDEMTEEQWINQHALTLDHSPVYSTNIVDSTKPEETATLCRTEPEPLQPTGSSEVYPSIDMQPDGES